MCVKETRESLSESNCIDENKFRVTNKVATPKFSAKNFLVYLKLEARFNYYIVESFKVLIMFNVSS